MMRYVKLLAAHRDHDAGEVVEVNDAQARHLVRSGAAVFTDPPKPKRKSKTAGDGDGGDADA